MNDNYKLCYIENDNAFFTTQELSKQWGDDWNDAPYEHNAGYPYQPEDNETFMILKIKFDTELQTPSDFAGGNSKYSVEDINSGKVAWLSSPKWMNEKINIFAGCSIVEFKSKIHKSGGFVYTKEGIRRNEKRR